MQNLLPAVCLLGFVTTAFPQEADNQRRFVRVSDLSEAKVIGILGVPVGEACEIEATIVSGDDSQAKIKSGRYLLNVETVNGKKVEIHREYFFTVWTFAQAKIANDHWSLHELVHKTKAQRLSSEEINVLNKDYVGSKVKLVVYETGRFAGQPNNLPEDIEWGVADTGFHFQTELVVLKQRE